MGGSGSSGFTGYSREDISGWITESQSEAATVEHNSDVNGALDGLLAEYNNRDTELTRSRLEEIQSAIEDDLDTVADLRFGGSVAKHTYVDGLSDVDALAILRNQDLVSLSAQEVLDEFAQSIARRLKYNVSVSEGQMAVTVEFPDGMKIQILPAIRTASGVRLPSNGSEEWSKVVRPEAFARQLTQTNQSCGGGVIPVIKLAKAALSTFPSAVKPSGYHVESLAIEAFKDYRGPFNKKDMLHHFFNRASQLVLTPIRDSTGQSLNVDDYLNEANSAFRRNLSASMERIARRMTNADRALSSPAWLQTIGEGPQ